MIFFHEKNILSDYDERDIIMYNHYHIERTKCVT